MKHLLRSSLFLCLIWAYVPISAQIPNGSIAPNFTLNDINGNSHTLYDYLDQGKMVILEFSATWCGPCWNYMQSGILEQVWEEHGPNGDNTVMMLYVEADQTTGMADLLGQTASSQGNWVAAIPFPIIDLQNGDNQDAQYQIGYYPTLFAICSDYTVWELGQVNYNTWSSYIQSCTLEGEIEEVEEALCYGEGSVTAGYSGGVPPISYEWNTGVEGPVLSNVPAGTYEVTITDNGGKWVVLEDVEVGGVTAPISLDDYNIEEPSCNGMASGIIDIELTGGAEGYAYQWSNGATSEDLSNVPAGDYTVSVVDDNGCEFEESFVIDEPTLLEAEADVSPENCQQEDGSIELDIEGGTGNYQVTSTSGDVFGHNIQNLTAGPVTVTVEDANGCIWQESFVIGFLDAPVVSIQQAGDLNCLQPTTSLNGMATSGSGEFQYAWTTSDGLIITGMNQSTVTVGAAGTYHLTVIDFESGCQTTSQHTVTANIEYPEADAGTDLPISCENNLPSLQGQGDASHSVSWTTLNGHIVSGGDTYTPVVDQPGEYHIHVTIPETGCTTTDTVVVLNELNPAVALYQYQTSNLTLIATDMSTGSNLTGWTWTFGDGLESTTQSPVHTYATEGIYEVCLTVENGCGSSQHCSLVELTSSGSVLSLNGNVSHVLCHGEATGSISLIVNGGTGIYTYSWTGPDSTVYETSDITDLIAGSYIVSVTDDAGNTVVGGFTIEQPEALSLVSSTVTDNLCYAANTGVISVEFTGGVAPYTYFWNGDLTPGQTNTLDQLTAGNYTCLINDANGCQLLHEFTVNEPAALIVSNTEVTNASGADAADGSIAVFVSGGTEPYTITWSHGATGSHIDGLLPGTYTYTIVDGNGCVLESQDPVIISYTVSANQVDPSYYLSILPNPSDGNVRVAWKNNGAGDMSLTLYSLEGVTIDHVRLDAAEGHWDLSKHSLSGGVYVVVLTNGQDVFPVKLVVMD